MALFANAAAKVASQAGGAAKAKPKSTVWMVGKGEKAQEREKQVSEAVHQLVELTRQAKTIESKMGLHKNVIKGFAEDMFFSTYLDGERFPETPMQVINSDGEKATYIVQDRSGQYAAKDEQVDQLTQILGEDAARNLVYEEVTIGFDRTLLAVPGVSEVVEKALERAIGKLVADELLPADQAENLIVATMKRSFRPGIQERLVQICGKNRDRMEAVVDALGSTCVRYVKA